MTTTKQTHTAGPGAALGALGNEALAVEDVRAAADVLRPVYDRTDHRRG